MLKQVHNLVDSILMRLRRMKKLTLLIAFSITLLLTAQAPQSSKYYKALSNAGAPSAGTCYDGTIVLDRTNNDFYVGKSSNANNLGNCTWIKVNSVGSSTVLSRTVDIGPHTNTGPVDQTKWILNSSANPIKLVKASGARQCYDAVHCSIQ